MIILFSPTKQMDYVSPLPPAVQNKTEWTEPLFLDQAQSLNDTLGDLGRDELKKLMKTSPALTEQTEKMISSFSTASRRPAAAAYCGTSFQSLDISSLDESTLRFAQKHLRILSGLYGVLRPLDLIAPYRLEMKTPLILPGTSSLTAFWKPLIRAELEGEEFVLNLASAEYIRAVSPPEGRMVEIQFKEEQGGRLKTVGMYAKKARGLMLREILLGRCDDPVSLRSLTPGGYLYSEELSRPFCWVFVRS